MSGGPGVRATVGAADTISRAVATFVHAAQGLAEGATASVRDFENRAASERDARRGALDEAKQARQRAEAALAACTENCEGLQRALNAALQGERSATEQYNASVQAVAILAEARSRLTRQAQTLLAALDRAEPGSRTAAEYRDQLQGYLRAGRLEGDSQHGNGGSDSWAGGSSSGSTGNSTSVSLAEVVDDRPGALSFEKVSREQVEWGLDILSRVVEPALRMGKGLDYFAERDRAEGLSGERSYTGVHNWFYSPDLAIKLSRRPDGRLDVTNGYHRIRVARQMGIANLPAQVR